MPTTHGQPPHKYLMKPLISCIMPTANRPEYIKLAIDSFLSQDYDNKELLILDDGKTPSLDISQYSGKGNIKYQYDGPIRKVIAKKLNLLCAWASGDIIARVDDDDYSAPSRLSKQYEIMNAGAEFTGFHCILFFDELSGKVYKYFSSRNFACGTSFMFTKDFWRSYKFNELSILGEDTELLDRIDSTGRKIAHSKLVAINGEQLIVARIHKKTSAAKTLEVANGYIEQSKDVLPEGFKALLNQEMAA